jgi:hypothetical protein
MREGLLHARVVPHRSVREMKLKSSNADVECNSGTVFERNHCRSSSKTDPLCHCAGRIRKDFPWDSSSRGFSAARGTDWAGRMTTGGPDPIQLPAFVRYELPDTVKMSVRIATILAFQ